MCRFRSSQASSSRVMGPTAPQIDFMNLLAASIRPTTATMLSPARRSRSSGDGLATIRNRASASFSRASPLRARPRWKKPSCRSLQPRDRVSVTARAGRSGSQFSPIVPDTTRPSAFGRTQQRFAFARALVKTGVILTDERRRARHAHELEVLGLPAHLNRRLTGCSSLIA